MMCFRMRSVIHHFKESRDFPRLRIGKLDDHFCSSYPWGDKSENILPQLLRRHRTTYWNYGRHRFCSTLVHWGRAKGGLLLLYCSAHFFFLQTYIELYNSETIYWSVQPEQQLTPLSTPNLLQLDSTFLRCLQAVRIMLLEGFNKSAIFVNTPCPQPPETLDRRKQSVIDSAETKVEV
jgi:hypothetical protein